MKSSHYKLKAIELLFYLFESLRKREQKPTHQRLSDKDIQSIYKVRDKIISSLSKPTSITDLTKIAAMNELKMRRLFTQVFGMGIYDYYQHLRMREAATLLREEKRSVSEVGYQIGFENLSHFTRYLKNISGKSRRNTEVNANEHHIEDGRT